MMTGSGGTVLRCKGVYRHFDDAVAPPEHGAELERALNRLLKSLAIQIARGCGACLNFNGALVLVPMLRYTLTWVRRRRWGHLLPVDEGIEQAGGATGDVGAEPEHGERRGAPWAGRLRGGTHRHDDVDVIILADAAEKTAHVFELDEYETVDRLSIGGVVDTTSCVLG